MQHICIRDKAGNFAENKDVARDMRLHIILPTLQKGEKIILDFKDVEGATQSFIHALLSDVLRSQGPDVLDHISFKNCNKTVQKIISIVVEYMQESA
jgi:hypothetical protein